MHPHDGNFVRQFAQLAAEHHKVEVLHVAPDEALVGRQLETTAKTASFGKVLSVYYAGGGARVQRLARRRKAWQRAISQVQEIPDLIHAHVLIDGGIIARQLAQRWSVPYLISCHSSRYLEGDNWSRRILDYPLARRAAAGAYALLPVSSALQAGLQKAGMQATFQVLPNVVDDTIFCPPVALSASTSFRIFHLSDGSRQKNLPLLLNAYAVARRSVENLALTLAGNIPQGTINTLLDLHPDVRPSIEFLGVLKRSEVVAEMGKHDLFVLSSSVETQGIVLIEALLCGLPLVTTDCGGPSDLALTEADGTVVKEPTTTNFAKAILAWAAKGRPTLAAREERHQRYAPRFNRKRLQSRLEMLYQDALSTSKKES